MPTGGSFGSGEMVIARRHSARSVVPTNPAALLASMVGWWDAPTYSGLGNLLNLGTAGAVGDMIPGATTAAPTFTTDHFTFDGVDDLMMTAGDVNAFDAPAKNAGTFSFGAVIRLPATAPLNFGIYFGKLGGAGAGGWFVCANGTTYANSAQVLDASLSGPAPVSAASSAGTKVLFAGVLPNDGNLLAYLNAASVSAADIRSASASSNAVQTGFGRSSTGTSPQKFDLYAAFVHQGFLTAPQLQSICTYYGVP